MKFYNPVNISVFYWPIIGLRKWTNEWVSEWLSEWVSQGERDGAREIVTTWVILRIGIECLNNHLVKRLDNKLNNKLILMTDCLPDGLREWVGEYYLWTSYSIKLFKRHRHVSSWTSFQLIAGLYSIPMGSWEGPGTDGIITMYFCSSFAIQLDLFYPWQNTPRMYV